MTTEYGIGCRSCGPKFPHHVMFEGHRHPENLAAIVVHAPALLSVARGSGAEFTVYARGIPLHGLVDFLAEHEGHELCVADEYGEPWPRVPDLPRLFPSTPSVQSSDVQCPICSATVGADCAGGKVHAERSRAAAGRYAPRSSENKGPGRDPSTVEGGCTAGPRPGDFVYPAAAELARG